MVEKVLHGVNVAACCGQLATAAVDIASTGGAATLISAGLSSLALRRTPDAQAELKDLCLQAVHAHMAQAGLVEKVQKQIVLMLDSYLPGQKEFAAGDMQADKIAKGMRDRVAEQSQVPEYTDEATLDAYQALLTAVLTALLAPKTQSEANQAELLKRTRELLEIARKSGKSDTLRDEGITEKAIIRLAQRISAETDDVGQAWLDLQNAMDIAVRVQAEGRSSSDEGDFVDRVLRQVAALAAEGEYATAGAEIEAALAEEDAAHKRRQSRLLDSGIELALLDGDAARATALILRRADHDAGGRADFAALRQVQDNYYVAGRDKGIALDLRVSIALAKLLVDRAGDSDETGAALNDLGTALQTLGERDSDTDRLEQAVEAYQQALKEHTRDRVPLDRAMAQYNWAETELTLFEKTAQAAHLDRAQDLLRTAAAEFAAAGASHYADVAARLQAKIDAARSAG